MANSKSDPKDLALQLLSHSSGFEFKKFTGLDSLQIFNDLGPLADQSMPQPEQPRVVQTVELPKKQPAAPKKPPTPSYGSNRPEYMPALKDQTVIQALLQVQKQMGVAPAPVAATPAAPKAKAEPQQQPKKQDAPFFEPAQIPYIEFKE